MIEYKYKEEKEILNRYAKKFQDNHSLEILSRGETQDEEEVRLLAKLYWRIVDTGTEDDLETWLERIYTSLHIYFNNKGLGEVWDSEIP